MKILIENNETLEYLTDAGQWTKNPRQAKHFPATEAAFQAARHETIGKFCIVGHIASTNQFINLDHGRGKRTVAEAAEPVAS